MARADELNVHRLHISVSICSRFAVRRVQKGYPPAAMPPGQLDGVYPSIITYCWNAAGKGRPSMGSRPIRRQLDEIRKEDWAEHGEADDDGGAFPGIVVGGTCMPRPSPHPDEGLANESDDIAQAVRFGRVTWVDAGRRPLLGHE